MISKLIHEAAGQKTYVLVFVTGDEVASGLTSFAVEKKVTAAGFTAIGALEDVELGYFDWAKKDYTKIPLKEQVEVLSLVGDVSEKEGGGVQVHAHIVVGASTDRLAAGTFSKGMFARPSKSS